MVVATASKVTWQALMSLVEFFFIAHIDLRSVVLDIFNRYIINL
jgi:hypothetical protein